jgi:hypothetical protein
VGTSSTPLQPRDSLHQQIESPLKRGLEVPRLEERRHAWNYSDLPIWDMLFGSWRNPETFAGEVGFDAPATRRLGAMLTFIDVNRPVAGPKNLGRKPTVKEVR